MITKEDNLKSLSCSLLNAGYMDVDFLINLVDTIDNHKFKIKGVETFLFTIQDEGKILDTAIENIKDYSEENPKIEINTLIYEVLNMIAKRINEIYDLSLEEGEDYDIYTNCLDSHLSLKDENSFLDEQDTENQISKEEQNEIKAIFEIFN